MAQITPLKVLFTGYAHVHYICFQPLHERLMARQDVDVRASGGRPIRACGCEVQRRIHHSYLEAVLDLTQFSRDHNLQ